MKLGFWALFFIVFQFIGIFPVFAENPNAGFVQGIWYSKEPVFEGVPTRIYVAIRNNTEHDLTATVRFSDNGVRIGSSDISALSGRLVEAWVDWVPKSGEHTISTTVTDAKLHIIGGGTQSIDFEGIVSEDTLTIDYDTDSDGIGNQIDTDDDNDGISDTDETKRGTNPLVPNPKVETTISEPVQEIQNEAALASTQIIESNDGLEHYISNDIASTLLGNATTKIETAKDSLDAYRTARNEKIEQEEKNSDVTTPTEMRLGTYTTENATITRTQLEPKKSFLDSFIKSIGSLLTLVWTFILWILSQLLAYPAIIELFILIGIVLMIYRIARRLGRRQRF